ncbi:MAG: hypothetical protein N2645_06690 [Clostridia bacterium]|nr:hypothetical protein [Clostridia bacterium]
MKKRNKILVRTMAVFMSAVLLCQSTVALEQKGKSNSNPTGKENSSHATGLRPMTEKDFAWMKENMIETKKVLPNELGLKRANEARKQRGMRLLDKDMKVLVGNEVTSEGRNRTFSSGAKVPADSNGQNNASLAVLGTDSLPASVDNSLLPYFPPIRNQGSLGSCASFSTTYYQMTHMTGLARGWNTKDDNDNTNKFSPKWVYNFINHGGDYGSSSTDAYRVMLNHGVPSWADFPYDSNCLEWNRDAAVWKRAINYKMEKAGYLFLLDSSDTMITGANDTQLLAAKQLLNNGYVLNYSTYVNSWKYKNIKNDPAVSADDPSVGQSIMYMVDGTDGGHAMTLVGYNDNIWVDINDNNVIEPGEKGAFKIANSWGPTWGLNGFMWVAYDSLNKVSSVPGAPTALNRQTAFGDDGLLRWITARPSYQPELLAEFTVRHAKRNQLDIGIGFSKTVSTVPNITWDSFIVNADSGPYAFDGTGNACDATFVLDLTELNYYDNPEWKWSAVVKDNQGDGNAALLKDFKVIDIKNGKTYTTQDQFPKVADNQMAYSSGIYYQNNKSIFSGWEFRENLPIECKNFGTAKINHKIYVIGGEDKNGNKLDILKEYDTLTDTWTSKKNMLAARSSFQAAAANGKIYVLGGINSQNMYEYSIDEYDPTLDTWTRKLNTAGYFYGACTAYSDNKIYLIGGYPDNYALNVYDPVANTVIKKSHMPYARVYNTSKAMNGKIYISGSIVANGAMQDTDMVDVYDIATNNWSRIANNLTVKSWGTSLCALSDRLYLYGGYGDNTIEEYDPLSNVWKVKDIKKTDRLNVKTEDGNNKIYIFGGEIVNEGISTAVECFDPAKVQSNPGQTPTPVPTQKPTATPTAAPIATTTPTNTPTSTPTSTSTVTPTPTNTPTPTGNPAFPAWSSNAVPYKINDIVTYKDKNYICIFNHTSNTAWTPDVCFTLWKIYNTSAAPAFTSK